MNDTDAFLLSAHPSIGRESQSDVIFHISICTYDAASQPAKPGRPQPECYKQRFQTNRSIGNARGAAVKAELEEEGT